MFSNCFPKIVPFMRLHIKILYSQIGHWWQYNTAHALCMLANYGYRQAHTPNTYTASLICVQCFHVSSAMYTHMTVPFLVMHIWWQDSHLCKKLISFTVNIISKLTHTNQNKNDLTFWLVHEPSVISGVKTLLLIYKVVQIWPGLFVCKQVTVCPCHIWTTLYFNSLGLPPM
jgi:hypothetical protein